MPNIQDILPPHAVASLPNLNWEYLAEQLWVHSQHIIGSGAHVFAGGIVVYNQDEKEATVKLDSLTLKETNNNSIIELTISYKDKDNLELKKLVIPDTQTEAYQESAVEDWSFEARRSYVADMESDPYITAIRNACERLAHLDNNTLEQKLAVLKELNEVEYFQEHVDSLFHTYYGKPDFWERVKFGFEKSGIIDLVSDYVDVTETAQSYDRLQAMDWLYQLYNRQTPNKPYIIINEHDQYVMLHVNENKEFRYYAPKVEVYTGDLHKTPLEVGVEIFDALSKVKRQRTLDTFMTTGDGETRSQSVKFKPSKGTPNAPRPFWETLNSATDWRPATEADIVKWLSTPPPKKTKPDGNSQNLWDMYNNAKEGWLESWRQFPAGFSACTTADTLYNAEDPAKFEYLTTQLKMSLQQPVPELDSQANTPN